MRDFTIDQFDTLISALIQSKYSFLSFENYCLLKKQNNLPRKFIISRHDIDKKPENAILIAILENQKNIHASYYFRMTSQIFIPQIIDKIVSLKHEIGYHYEDYNNNKGNLDNSISTFTQNLSLFRRYYHTTTISMHGNPTAKYDEGLLWDHLDTTKLGLLGEPYHSIDFDTVFYLTDTGRRWDGYKVSIWDKVPQQELWNKQGLTFHSTQDIIRAIKKGQFPNQVMITTHPQRWTNSYSAWLKELLVQSMKNVVKRVLIVLKSRMPKLFTLSIKGFN